jgi:hypothetical protein
MIRSKHVWSLAAVVLLLGAPGRVGAEWHITPFTGVNFGGSASDESLAPGRDGQSSSPAFGVTTGWKRGRFGADADLAYAPTFFDDDGGFVTKTSVLTFMGNGRFVLPLGMDESWQPFASGGLGIIRPNLGEPGGLAEVDDAKFGWNVGGGVTGFLGDHVGVTGDVRYFRTMDDEDEVNPFAIDFSGFDFWRGSVGVTFRW